MNPKLDAFKVGGYVVHKFVNNPSFRRLYAMKKVSIIPYADRAHRDHVITLWDAVFHYDAPHNRPSTVIDKKMLAEDELFFVAVIDESVVGTVMAGYDGHRGWIYSLAVSPSVRRQGIGSSLMSAAEGALRDMGCMKINLQILAGNEEVTAFYSALGYLVEQRVSMGKQIHENIPIA
jgi:ribosomal protein S18 acetylase RimI-like enzyme